MFSEKERHDLHCVCELLASLLLFVLAGMFGRYVNMFRPLQGSLLRRCNR